MVVLLGPLLINFVLVDFWEVKHFCHYIDAGYICSFDSTIELHDDGVMKEVLNLLIVSELREISSVLMKVCFFFFFFSENVPFSLV